MIEKLIEKLEKEATSVIESGNRDWSVVRGGHMVIRPEDLLEILKYFKSETSASLEKDVFKYIANYYKLQGCLPDDTNLRGEFPDPRIEDAINKAKIKITRLQYNLEQAKKLALRAELDSLAGTEPALNRKAKMKVKV